MSAKRKVVYGATAKLSPTQRNALIGMSRGESVWGYTKATIRRLRDLGLISIGATTYELTEAGRNRLRCDMQLVQLRRAYEEMDARREQGRCIQKVRNQRRQPMGCDIHAFAEKRVGDKWEQLPIAILDGRSYSLFGWLAGVRNYSAVPPISVPRGLPADVSDDTREDYDKWCGDAHSASWLSLSELHAFDYDQPVEDRRITVQTGPNSWNGGATAEPGSGKMTTYREFLGQWFFDELDKMSDADRIVFWFDN